MINRTMEGYLPPWAIVMAKRRTIESPEAIRVAFVGQDAAGALLDKMIEAMGLKREEIVIEATWSDREDLLNRLARIRPERIVTLGSMATDILLDQKGAFARVRGKFQAFEIARVMPTAHPAELEQNPAAKKEAWEDLKKVCAELGVVIPVRKAKP